MSFSQPNSPDPTQVSNSQQGYNLQAAQNQNKTNSYNQSNAFGSQTYNADPNSPSGYSLNTQLSAPLQQLFNTQTGTQNLAANTGQQSLQNSAGMYSSPYDLNAATGQTANLLNKWNQQYLRPIFNQQQSNKDAQLQNQGLAPGSEAYNNAQNLLARNQGDVTNQYLTQNENQAFGQAMQQYQLPLQTASALSGFKTNMPGNPTFGATPTSQIQPPNYAQAAQNNYQNQQAQFQNTMSGLGQVAGLVAAPFTGGLSMLPGMFAGGMSASSMGGGWGAADSMGPGQGW